MDGSKYDNGKPRVGEMLQDFAEPLLEVTKAWEYGASKYEERNWRKVSDGETRYTNALLRHLIEEETNPCDEESRLLHATHVAWNALARLWFILQERKLRPVSYDIKNNAIENNTVETVEDVIYERLISDYYKDKKIDG